MITRQEIITIAKTYVDTPYQHQARCKHIGIDCAGLIIEVAKEANIFENGSDYSGYSMIPDGITLQKHLDTYAVKKNINDLKEGDIILFKLLNNPQHLAIYLGNNLIIHAYSTVGKTTIHRLDDKWNKRIVAVYSYKGVQD
jgi:cell wall-associated NlpC family hydrolase